MSDCNAKRGRPPLTRAIELYRAADASVAAGDRITVYPDKELPPRDNSQRHNILRAIEIDATVTLTTTLVNMTAAYPGEYLYNLLQQIKIKAGGVPLVDDNVEGRFFRDHQFLRYGGLFYPDPSDLPDADDTPSVTVKLVIPFHAGLASLVSVRGATSRQFDHGLPAGVFDRDRGDEISFTLASALDYDDNGGVAVTDFDQLVVRGIYDSVPKFKVGDIPFVREWETAEQKHIITRYHADEPGRFAYVVARHRPEDNGGDTTVGIYDNVSVKVGGEDFFEGLNGEQVADLMFGTRIDPTWMRGTAVADYDSDPTIIHVPFVKAPPLAKMTDLADGPVRIKYTRSTQNNTRLLACEYSAPNDQWRERIARRHGLDDVILKAPRANEIPRRDVTMLPMSG